MSEDGSALTDPARITFTVDPTMYEGANAFPGGVFRDLDLAVRPNLYYHYSTPVCAQRWLDVCEDPAYGHKELVARVDEALPDLMAALKADWKGPTTLAVTSLGPGDGVLDEHLLRGLAREFRLEEYRGLDFSFDLLRRAAHRLAQAQGLPGGLPLRFICGDFTDLATSRAWESGAGGARLFSMTGFTLGNYCEDDLLRSVGALMRAGDYLLLDARLHTFDLHPTEGGHGPPSGHDLLGSYDLDSVRRFVFGPVEVATLATAEDVEIGIEVTRSLTAVPNALNLVIFCSNLSTAMRLTGKAVQRARLDLAVTTRYHPAELLEWFPIVELEPVWHEELGEVGFYLLRKG